MLTICKWFYKWNHGILIKLLCVILLFFLKFEETYLIQISHFVGEETETQSRKKLCSLIYCCRTFPHPLQRNSLNLKIFLFFLTILCVRHSNKAWLGDSSTPQSTDWSDHLLFITVHLWATNHLYFFYTKTFTISQDLQNSHLILASGSSWSENLVI